MQYMPGSQDLIYDIDLSTFFSVSAAQILPGGWYGQLTAARHCYLTAGSRSVGHSGSRVACDQVAVRYSSSMDEKDSYQSHLFPIEGIHRNVTKVAAVPSSCW